MRSKEIFEDVPEFPNYQVTTHGRVYNQDRRSFLSVKRTKGYVNVTLCRRGFQKQIGVHVLVAMAFIDANLEGKEVNHIDGDKNNNHVDNLEILIPRDNKMHAWSTGLMPENHHFAPSAIRNVDTDEVFDSASAAARSVGVTPQRIAAAVRAEGSRVRGYRFEMADN